MRNLPSDRQKRRPRLTAKRLVTRERAPQQSLKRAFLTFTEAAGSLEKSYAQLQSEVARLRVELESANHDLSRSLEETSRVRAFLARVLEGLPCGVIVADALGRVHVINPEARRLLQLADWQPGTAGPLPRILEGLFAEVPKTFCSSEQEWTCDLIPGNRIIGIMRTKPEEASQDELETIWILRDVTDQKRLAKEREAARRTQALAEVAAVLAHEIRNPLGSMELFTGLLADATVHMPETRQWVMHLQAGLRSLSATVNNVLQFHSQPTDQRVPTGLDRLLRETVDFLVPLARQRGQEIVLENPLGQIVVAADPHRLQQVFLNLALNAFRAMPPERKLTVRVRRAPQFPGGVVQIEFQDQGHGMAPELLDRIFEPGFTTTAGSPGLGLAVSKRVIEQHGGTITAQSQPQAGSTFRVLLPLKGETE